MLKFTLKCPVFAPTCFRTPGPSSGSLYRAWLKVRFTHSVTLARLSISSLKMVRVDRNM